MLAQTTYLCTNRGHDLLYLHLGNEGITGREFHQRQMTTGDIGWQLLKQIRHLLPHDRQQGKEQNHQKGHEQQQHQHNHQQTWGTQPLQLADQPLQQIGNDYACQ